MENEDQNWLSAGRVLVSRCQGDRSNSPAPYSKGWFVYFLFFCRPPSCLVFIFVGNETALGFPELTVDFLIGIDPRGVDDCYLKECPRARED